ncbi:transmembrane 7 superfamily member 3 isoform X2 [Ptiloglossa arizonensis]
MYNVTLSYRKDHTNTVLNSSVFGSNIGLVIKNGLNKTNHLYLKNDNAKPIEALLAVVPYNNSAPVPGGCNMEFNTKIAPYAKVQIVHNSMIVVDIQPASMPFNGNKEPICEKNPVNHDVYQININGTDSVTYFMVMKSVFSKGYIEKYGRKVPSSNVLSPMRRVFAAYIGYGFVYVAVARYKNFSTAYVPAVSYGCNPQLHDNFCEILFKPVYNVIFAICFIIGYCNFRWIPILFAGTVTSFVIATIFTSIHSEESNTWISISIGIVLTLLWICFSTSEPAIVKPTLSWAQGLFLACLVYHFIPGIFQILFWLIFVSLIIIFYYALYDVSCSLGQAMYSTTMIILPLDHFFKKHLIYIIINVVRRIAVPGFEKADTTSGLDILLMLLWLVLVVYRTCSYKNPEE